jgi:UDP-glucose 4-epimerase
MKILITGGSGFIGHAVVTALLQAKHDITIVDIKMPNFPGHIHFFHADILNKKALSEVFEKVKPEIVIHLAGCTDSTAGHDYIYNCNVKGTLNIIDTCLNNKVKKFIFASTCMVYGKNSKLKVAEKVEVAPQSLYAFTKAVGESLIKASGLNYIIFRMFNVSGPGFTHDPPRYLIPTALAATLEKPLRIFTKYNDIRDYVHVDDIARAYVLACISKVKDAIIINLGTGIPSSLGHVIDMVREARGILLHTIIDYNAPGLNKQEGIHLTANIKRAEDILHWIPQKKLSNIIKDAADWFNKRSIE